MRAIDLTQPFVVTADESTSLIDAAKMMRDEGVGDIVITQGIGRRQKPIGLITDRDIVVHAIACDLDLDSITVGDLRLRDLATVGPDADLTEVTAAMNRDAVRRVLISEDSELRGLVSMDDVIGAVAELMNNLTAMLARQIEYERDHIEKMEDRDTAA